jgi:hypothetical protein
MEWRAISDVDKSAEAHPFRGTLPQVWETIERYNNTSHGIFVTPSAMDGNGRKLENVWYIRAQYADLDKGSVEANAARANASDPAPCFAVHTSPSRQHVYWPVAPYQGNDRFQTMQRKLATTYGGDPAVNDATRVMRLSGTWNWKYDEPFLTHCTAMRGYLQPSTIEALEAAYASVQVIDGGAGERHELGEPELAAPSLDWLMHAMALIDPNNLDRNEWLSMSAAFKQAGWTLTDPDTLLAAWLTWCARYTKDNAAENIKLWKSVRSTELGWHSLLRRNPSLKASMAFGAQAEALVTSATPPMPTNSPPPLDCSGEMLTAPECKEYFKGCVSIIRLNKIMTPEGEFLNSSQFNQRYGGKLMIWNSAGKTTDEAWKAATRSTVWSIPKVSHTRFLPQQPSGAIITDALGRTGVNTYVRPNVALLSGDITPFTWHMEQLIPDPNDRAILFTWMAHIIKFPGFKIPWAPVIQSAEGAGKGVIEFVMTHGVGEPYCHFPNAQELADSGGKFNGWMRNKIFILADEIKVDEKRHMIEVLKPLISRESIEVQSKGVDQGMEDNAACWGFFTNYKDAIPVGRNGRRYSIFYSPLQTEKEVLARGMDDKYFSALYNWIKADGKAMVVNWLMNLPVERGSVPMRAPKTSSWDEAIAITRSPVERVVQEAIDDQIPGFRGGWVSILAAGKRIRAQGAARGNVPPHVIAGVLETLGYVASGRAPRMFMQDDPEQITDLFHVGQVGDVSQFGRAQGWE